MCVCLWSCMNMDVHMLYVIFCTTICTCNHLCPNAICKISNGNNYSNGSLACVLQQQHHLSDAAVFLTYEDQHMNPNHNSSTRQGCPFAATNNSHVRLNKLKMLNAIFPLTSNNELWHSFSTISFYYETC